jgi:DNA-binding NtrC family response regulator
MSFVLKLIGRPWNRNVRELEKVVAAVAAGNRNRADFLEPPIVSEAPVREPVRAPQSVPPPGAPHSRSNPTEADLIRELEANDHVQHRAAKALGISRTTLDKWLRDLGIRRPKDVTREAIEQALAEGQGDLERVAKTLKVSLRGLKLRMTELGIEAPRGR